MFELRIRNGTLHVVVSYKGHVVFFKVSSLGKSGLSINDEDLFKEINRYIETLDFNDQFRLFEIYQEIRELRDDVGVSFRAQQRETKELVKEIYEIIDIESLKIFMMTQTHVQYPTNLLSVNDPNAYTPTLNVNINYFLEDYKGLVVLVVALRPMIPIWAEYIEINVAATGANFKEFRAYQLIKPASVFKSAPMERLCLYVTEWLMSGNKRKELEENAGVLDSISSDGLSDLLLAKILVRKISVVNISAKTDKESIISSVYNYLNTKITETAKDFRTFDKKLTERADDGESEKSVLENYKISTKITHGDIAFIVQYCSDPVKLAYDIDPTIPSELVMDCVQVNQTHGIQISYHMLAITQWIMNKVIPANAIVELQVNEMIYLVSACQALLIHWGFLNIALIITGRRKTDRVVATALSVGIDDALLKQLDHHYPYFKPHTRNKIKANVAHTSLISLTDHLTVHSLEIMPPNALREIPEFQTGVLTIPPTIINDLARLLIKLNEI